MVNAKNQMCRTEKSSISSRIFGAGIVLKSLSEKIEGNWVLSKGADLEKPTEDCLAHTGLSLVYSKNGSKLRTFIKFNKREF